MSARIRGQQDFLAGLLFLFFGLLALYIGRDYPMGTAMRMGPGYFPAILGGLVSLLSIALLVRGLIVPGERAGGFAILPLLLILAAVALFALTVEDLGIMVAVALVVVVSSLANGKPHWGEILMLTAIMVGLAVGVFTYGLSLPFKIWPI